ncbi:MAG: hypothetical protein KAT77_06165 [Nanoarchaeota archaeon]|nr:hypothetical protein [Nanoarchaeota archaeon]
MVDLTGEVAEEAQEALNDLHHGIDIGQKIVTATHSLENKLLSLDLVFTHISFNYDQNIIDFFWEMQEIIEELVAFLESEERKELHIVAEEKAALKLGKKWVLKHREVVEEEIKKEILVEKEIIQKIHEVFTKIKTLIEKKQIFTQHHEKAAEVKHILEKLFHFFSTYEQIFKKLIKELEN